MSSTELQTTMRNVAIGAAASCGAACIALLLLWLYNQSRS